MTKKKQCGNCRFWHRAKKECKSPFTFTVRKTKEDDSCKHYVAKNTKEARDK